YAVTQRKGAALLTGDYGCGKTLISRLLLDTLYDLGESRFEIALIVNPRLSPEELLQKILYEFGIEDIPPKRLNLLQALNELLLAYLKADKQPVIIIDEAQMIMDEETVDELRVLLNFQLNNRFLLTLLLIGQPEFSEIVEALPQLKQRLAVRYHIGPLKTYEETQAYIRHRLAVAKAEREIFTDRALRTVHELTQGIPREINNICDVALLTGFMHKLTHIDADIIERW
ncbi:MAG: AAA family ATPase, partial [Candidatus Poribacteria bacterium]|nr:AAA family ATPase [Candidatus Poribacteria bacterium]